MEPILVFHVCVVVSDFKPSQDMSTGHEKVIGQIHKRDQSRGKMHVLCEIHWILWSVSSLVHMLGTQAMRLAFPTLFVQSKYFAVSDWLLSPANSS